MFTFELEKFRKIKDTIEYKKLSEDIVNKGLDFDNVSRFAATTHFSIIALYYFIKEDFPELEKACNDKIKSLKEFYGYDQV